MFESSSGCKHCLIYSCRCAKQCKGSLERIDLCLFSALVRHPVNFLDAAHNEMVRERQVCGYPT